MKFNFEKKDNYSHENVLELLEQNAKFITKQFKEYVSPKDHDLILTKLSKYEKNEKMETLKKTLENKVDDSKIDALIKLGDLMDIDDESIMKVVESTIKEYPFLINNESIVTNAIENEQNHDQNIVKKDYKYVNPYKK